MQSVYITTNESRSRRAVLDKNLFMLFYVSVISRLSVLLVEETGVPGENHRPAASEWQTLSHNFVSNTPHPVASIRRAGQIKYTTRPWNGTQISSSCMEDATLFAQHAVSPK